ncbi:DUF6516 family protein [Xenorhabdus bovienii]|uniref:Uncharacterized protein n=1 Tax=Xenorhabdus bovienii str. Intermedium TaxID=1379677 RepID=A0A077QBK8_XENBV|nr:DUF6516 family protein [Xenorhabdus bovienii]CDH33627.1 conserved hypothetical protein [Xenorhabdus bovienii str. Intermedium]
MRLSDVITDCVNLKLSGSATDTAIQCFGGNILQEERPVLAIEVSSKEILLWMMQGATNVHIYISAGTFHVNALYEPTDRFPAARIYFMKSEDLFWVGHIGAYIEQHGVKLAPVNDASFSKLIDDAGYVQRYVAWHEKRKTDASLFDGLLGGRLENTAVDQGIWLSSDGRCLVCGEKTDRMATSTVWGKSGMIIGMQLCLTHEAESQKQSTLLNYLTKHLGGTVMFSNMRPRTTEEKLEQTCEALKVNLKCTIVKVEEKTVTARRQSGITVIIRQHSLSNYAYNILSPEGKQLSRVDSANHHKVPYGPDHVHSDLRKSTKNVVEASFTYGDVGLDMKLLLKLIQEAEDKL